MHLPFNQLATLFFQVWIGIWDYLHLKLCTYVTILIDNSRTVHDYPHYNPCTDLYAGFL